MISYFVSTILSVRGLGFTHGNAVILNLVR